MKSIRFEFEGIPPSVNKIYFTRGRSRFLTKEGRRFKNAWVSSYGGADILDFLALELDEDTPYSLTFIFYIRRERLFNATYGKRKGVKRFKKMDVSNLVKLTEDAIAELLSLPDQNNFSIAAHKRVADGAERVIATLTPLDLENESFPE
jgi:Holliday junction resolvase RusA-like endonuclease